MPRETRVVAALLAAALTFHYEIVAATSPGDGIAIAFLLDRWTGQTWLILPGADHRVPVSMTPIPNRPGSPLGAPPYPKP